jgi:predicted MFS family arabinose efflux permease
MESRDGEATPGTAPTVAVLFGCLFTVQASLVALSPVLPLISSELRVTVAAVGQLRTISGLAAAAVAVAMVVTNRLGRLREPLLLGLGLLVLGTLGSALAPAFWSLAAAQVVLGAGVALVLSGALAATRQWIPAPHRGRALSWTLIGQPAAWIVGLPAIGAIGDSDWRLAWLVPLLSGIATLILLLLLRRDDIRPPTPLPPAASVRQTSAAGWAAAELLAYAGWTAILLYAGALLSDAYDLSIGTTGLLLGLGAVAYLPGNILARRRLDRLDGIARPLSIGLASAMSVTGLVFAGLRPSLGFSLAVFALFAFLGGARTIAGSSLGLALGGAPPLRAMSLRTASVQSGYLAGAGLGGIGLALAGWAGLGVMLATSLALSAVLLARWRPRPALVHPTPCRPEPEVPTL